MGKNKKKEKELTNRAINKEVPVEDVFVEKEFLTDKELQTVMVNAEKHEVFKKIQEISRLKHAYLLVRKELLKSKLDALEKDIKLLEYAMKEENQAYSEFKEKSKKDLAKIGKSHGFSVKDKFGYDPETGEIKT